MIDGSEKRNRQLVFELQNSHVCEKRSNTTAVAIFPNVCLWRRSLCSDLTLKNSLDPEKLYRATFICQDGLCCCNVALISFRLFRKNLGNLRDVFEQMVYRPPWQKISRTLMEISNRNFC